MRLLLWSLLIAIWTTFQFPALVLPSSEGLHLSATAGISTPQEADNPRSTEKPARADVYTTSRPLLPNAVLSRNHELSWNRLGKKRPAYFEANHGQAGERVKFLSRGKGYTLSLAADEVIMALEDPSKTVPTRARAKTYPNPPELQDAKLQDRTRQPERTVRMKLLGGNPEPKLVGINELPGKSNYFIGKDPKKWRHNVPHYGRVRYQEVYPGVDLVFYGNDSQFEFDFIVAPGTDPDVIRMEFDGADKAAIDKAGHLILETSIGSIRVKKPFIYQELNGITREVSGHYLLDSSASENLSSSIVAFELASYDTSKPLVIDPGLEFSTFLGSDGIDDGNGIALDPAGNIYVVGSTGLGYGVIDIFVAKFSPDFSLLYVTVFGGSINGKAGAGDWGRGIAVDAAGNAYVTGRIESLDFPVTDGTSPNDYADAFVAKLGSDGSTLLYSRRLGGAGWDEAHAIALDFNNNAYVTGWTTSSDFPTTPAAFDTTHRGFGYSEVFVAKISADGSQLLYSTFLGGASGLEGEARGNAIALDGNGNAHVTGGVYSAPAFPATAGSFDTSWNGNNDVFVAKLSNDGTQLLYGTYIGGSLGETGVGIALDAAGNAFITGETASPDFPTTPQAFATMPPNNLDIFVVKLSPDGSRLLYSTFLGSSTGDSVNGIAVDGIGNAYLIGTTCGSDFPTTAEAFSRSFSGGCFPFGTVDGDAYVAKLSADGSRLLYSTYLGGDAGDEGWGIAVDPAGNVYVTGQTESLNFPVTPDSFAPGEGPWDAFLAKLSPIDTAANPGTLGFSANGYSVSEDAGTAVITVERRNGKDGEVSVDFATSDSDAGTGSDYVPTAGTLVFGHGETSKTFTITILDDNEHESSEGVLVTLSNVRGGATLGGVITTVVLTIKDQDPPAAATLTVDKNGSGSGTVSSGNFRFDIKCGSICSRSYGSGIAVTLTATPDPGSTFAGWSGGGCSGTSSCTVTVTADTTVTATFNLPDPITPLAFLSMSVPEGEVGSGYKTSVSAGGGVPPYSLTVVKGTLPPGLLLNGLELTGTPVRADTFRFSLQLTDSSNMSVTRQFSTRIFKAVAIKTRNLPTARAGRNYSERVAATGGKSPYSWSVQPGSLPPGLSFDAATGRVTGVPTAAGSFAASFRVTDSLGATTEKTIDLTVR